MKVELIREAKYYCNDFAPIRDLLIQINVQYITVKQQSDFIYKIYDPSSGEASKRIKVRIENDESITIYVYNRKNPDNNITFDHYQVQDRQIISIFSALYGESINIRKVRELWKKENIIFHLDTVDGVGNIFEIELLKPTGSTGVEDLKRYKKLFQRFLLQQINGSNEDLVPWKG